MWIVQLAQYGPRPNDWLHLKIVADHFVGGDWAHLYSTGSDSINPGYLWRYPPFALYLVAPLAWLSPPVAYALLITIEVAALGISLVLLARLAPPPAPLAHIWVLAVVTSAPALSTVIAGQSSGLILLLISVAAWCWTRGRVLVACALLGVLAVKPNWGVFFGLYAIWIGEWRGAAAMAAVAGALCAMSLPLGSELWRGFIDLSLANNELLAPYPAYKVITLKGFIDGLVGPGDTATALWSASIVALAVAAARAWARRRSAVDGLGITVIFAICANPYASFYDALVLTIPAAVWLADRGGSSPRRWSVIGIGLAAFWCGEHYAYTWTNILESVGWSATPLFSVVGPMTAVWLVIRVPSAAPADR
jgi:hypothetical protein